MTQACKRCAGVGELHSRVANPQFERQPITYTETHRNCDLCGDSAVTSIIDQRQPKETT